MRPSHPILVLCLGIAGYSILHSGQAAADCSAVLTPYTASYQVFKDNKEVGVMDVSLKESGGAYSYSMLTRGTKGMASFVNLAIDQVSDFTMGTELPIPHSYRQTQKTSLWKKTEWVDFDWTDMTASGEKNKKEFDRKLADGMQDKSTLYLASALAVCGGNPEFEMNVVSGPEPRNYIFNLQQAETLETALGAVDTIRVHQKIQDQDKETDTWHVPSLHYVPAKISYRNGKELTVMNLLEFSPAENQVATN